MESILNLLVNRVVNRVEKILQMFELGRKNIEIKRKLSETKAAYDDFNKSLKVIKKLNKHRFHMVNIKLAEMEKMMEMLEVVSDNFYAYLIVLRNFGGEKTWRNWQFRLGFFHRQF